MPAPTRPTNYSVPFANAGTRNAIASTPTGDQHASFSGGFPPVTMQAITSGGIPPDGADFNGIFYDLMTHTVFINAGGQYQFDSTLSTAIGGYPQGFVLQNNAGTASYISMVNSNTTDFNATPSSIGTLWGSYSGPSFSNVTISTTGGATTLTSIQAAASFITITGSLTSNAVLTFPAQLGVWEVINSTTGAFTVTAIASGGTGVAIKQGAAEDIYCNAVNINYTTASAANRNAGDASLSSANTLYADRAADQVGGFHVDSGTTDNYIIAMTPPISSAPSYGITVRFLSAHVSTGAAATLNAGWGAVTLVKGDGSAPRSADISTTAVMTATYVPSLTKWVLNGLIIPDATINVATYITATQTLIKGRYRANTVGGSFGCNLNTSPSLGDTLYIEDPTGNWGVNPLTIASTGAMIAYTNYYGTLITMASYVNNVPGNNFAMTYDGTYWRLS